MSDHGEAAWGQSTDDLFLAWSPEDSDPSVLAGSPPPSLGGESLAPMDFHFGPASVGQPLNATRTRAGGPGRSASAERFPEPGEELAGFYLVRELGRGAFARVYLAEQRGLAGRPVALKVAQSMGDEPQNLARLQHTHIVPIHSVHDDPASGLRLLCMPYVGGANLAEVLERAHIHLPTQATGRSLVAALDAVGEDGETKARWSTAGGSILGRDLGPSRAPSLLAPRPAEGRTATEVRSIWGRCLAKISVWSAEQGEAAAELSSAEPGQPARRYLRSASYVQAAVWIAARLAEALEHAHERGILHRDIKPSNVLIAADGTPMLLDFNLSTRVRAESEEAGKRAAVGGTLPYMAPEHLDAFNPGGKTDSAAVDERSDIYSLGLILFEMAAGRHPFSDQAAGLPLAEILYRMTAERRRGAPSARAINPRVSWGLDSVLRRALDPDPSRRYQRAGDLAEDLRRLLDDRPLKFAPEPSLRERAAKWGRRHPRASSSASIGAVAIALLAGLGGFAFKLNDHLATQRAFRQRSEFRSDFNRCQLLLNTASGPVEHLDRGLNLAEHATSSYGATADGHWTTGPLVARLTAPERKSLREEMSELFQLMARARIAKAERARATESDRRAAIESGIGLLDRALAFDPRPSASMFDDRSRYHAALGDHEAAARDRAVRSRLRPSTARDFYLIGTSRLARGETESAEIDLTRATSLDPRRFWAWFALGLCHYQQGRFAEAAGDFGTCTVLYPDFSWPQLNRGLAFAAAGRLTEARAAYDQALQANGNFVEARINRGLVCLELGDAVQAERDLGLAITLGRHDPAILAAHAESLGRLGRRDEALKQFEEGLKRRPDDPVLLVARGFFLLSSGPAKALEDFRRVLVRDPSNARAHLGIAFALRPTDVAAATRHASLALEASPDFGDALQVRANLLARSGDARAEEDVDRLVRVPTPQRLYNAACALANLATATGERRHEDRALILLRRAIESGFPKATASQDDDLKALRTRPELRGLLTAAAPRRGDAPARP